MLAAAKEVVTLRGKAPVQGTIDLPGDKSISHRALILAFLTKSETKILNLNRGQDCLHTLQCLKQLGLQTSWQGDILEIGGVEGNWQQGKHQLYAGNSGTTVRLLMGAAAALAPGGELTILGDESLSRRPMARVARYLEPLGVKTAFPKGDGLPLILTRGEAQARGYMDLTIPSAQLKSAVLLAALAGDHAVTLRQQPTRNHTELMLQALGADIAWQGEEVALKPGTLQFPPIYTVAGDISTGAFFAGAAALGGQVLLRNAGINPTRRGILDILETMGAQVKYLSRSNLQGEEVADVLVTGGELRGVDIQPEQIPFLIDELPLLAAVALLAKGVTQVRGAGELQHKESNRLLQIARMVQAFGGKAELLPDGFMIHGQQPLRPAEYISDDHRLVMAAAVAALAVPGASRIGEAQAAEISAPGFWPLLAQVCPGAGISV